MESHTIKITKQVKTREQAETPYQVMSPSRRELFFCSKSQSHQKYEKLKGILKRNDPFFPIYPPLPTNIHGENSKMCFCIQSYKIKRRNKYHLVSRWHNAWLIITSFKGLLFAVQRYACGIVCSICSIRLHYLYIPIHVCRFLYSSSSAGTTERVAGRRKELRQVAT